MATTQTLGTTTLLQAHGLDIPATITAHPAGGLVYDLDGDDVSGQVLADQSRGSVLVIWGGADALGHTIVGDWIISGYTTSSVATAAAATDCPSVAIAAAGDHDGADLIRAMAAAIAVDYLSRA